MPEVQFLTLSAKQIIWIINHMVGGPNNNKSARQSKLNVLNHLMTSAQGTMQVLSVLSNLPYIGTRRLSCEKLLRFIFLK